MMVSMREVQVAQERYGDYRKDVQQWRMMRGETPAKQGIWQTLRTTFVKGIGSIQGIRVQERTGTPAASISGSSH